MLAEGKVNLARRLLGRPYGVEGRVERGAERGRTLGFPTANLHPRNRVIPRHGVYATGTLIDGKWRRSVTNVGVRPTFGTDTEPSVETFVIDWAGDLYGDVVRVRFLHRLRDEKKFASVLELKTQIGKDLDRAQSYFERNAVRSTAFAGLSHMNTEQALVPMNIKPSRNGTATAGMTRPGSNETAPKSTPPPEPLNDETVAAILKGRGLRGWLHVARVSRVLGLFTLYIFLDTYDIRASFNQRMIERRREAAKSGSWIVRLKTHARQFLSLTLDKSIRLLRR